MQALNKSMQKVAHFFIGLALVFPLASYSAPGTFATKPLWLGESVQNNIIFAIDDSGSMDFEVLFQGSNDGALWLGDDDGSFINSDGSYNQSGKKYVYLFPNGSSGTYNGSRIYSDHFAIPPAKAYAFARSSDFNSAYYDSAVEYQPWPTYGGFTFSDSSTSATPFEPEGTGKSTLTINLFTDLNTSSEGEHWDFDIEHTDMVCDNSGTTSCSDPYDTTYYPATYYKVDKTSTYTYTPPLAATFSTENTVIFDHVNTVNLSSVIKSSDQLSAATALSYDDAVAAAEGGDFWGTDNSVASVIGADPTGGELRFSSFTSDGSSLAVWMRVWAQSPSNDSFWVKVEGPAGFSFKSDFVHGTYTDDHCPGCDYLRMNSLPTGSWQWVKAGEISSPVAGDYTLNVKYRENQTYLDQVVITSSGNAPSGIAIVDSLVDSVERNCADPADTIPDYYHDFVANPASYTGVDAIGPDGSCLKKYEIKTGETFPSGRTVEAEKQNFANWFTYYRRRHQGMRGGLASAMQGISGINAGIFWINDKSNVTMYDFDEAADVTSFLDEHYKHVRSGGTPLRSALKYAGEQFKRTDDDAPVQLACQKNATLLFTDGFNSETSVDGIDNEDDGKGAPYEDAHSGTLGDVAMKYYTETLRTGTGFDEGEVPVALGCSAGTVDSSLDCNANLHMNTYVVGLGVEGEIFGVTHHSVSDAYATPPSWPDVNNSRDPRQIDDLYHAAVNGRGGMFSADSPQELNTALQSAIDSITAGFGSGSGVTFNSSSLSADGDSAVYITQFDSSNNWKGDLLAWGLDSSGGIDRDSGWGSESGAGSILDDRNLTTHPRDVITFNGTDGVKFTWDNLTTDQQNDLLAGGSDTDEANARLNFILGDRSNEAIAPYQFRRRSSRLGDIVNSAPLYIAAPGSNWPNVPPFAPASALKYDEWKVSSSVKNRTPLVYVAANDGMLHAFKGDPDTSNGGGEEVFAYLPGGVYDTDTAAGLSFLTDPNYVHKYYHDLTPVAQDVYMSVDTGSTETGWRTMLVGGYRTGARGLYALDITDPTILNDDTENPEKVALWEFGASIDDDLGYLVTPPTIAMMNNSKYAVVFGNGYHSPNGTTALFILFVEGGLDGTWTVGSDYKKIVLNIDTESADGLSGVTLADLDGDSITDRIYGGDLQGNMWAFDVSNVNPDNWAVAYDNGGGTNLPLFKAANADGEVQPITAAPNLAF